MSNRSDCTDNVYRFAASVFLHLDQMGTSDCDSCSDLDEEGFADRRSVR